MKISKSSISVLIIIILCPLVDYLVSGRQRKKAAYLPNQAAQVGHCRLLIWPPALPECELFDVDHMLARRLHSVRLNNRRD
jgi:hypothetical protein